MWTQYLKEVFGFVRLVFAPSGGADSAENPWLFKIMLSLVFLLMLWRTWPAKHNQVISFGKMINEALIAFEAPISFEVPISFFLIQKNNNNNNHHHQLLWTKFQNCVFNYFLEHSSPLSLLYNRFILKESRLLIRTKLVGHINLENTPEAP